MESIKIVDKLTLRQEALRMAVELSKSHPEMISDTIKNAGIFENYIKGFADLPEYVDPNADKQQWVDMLNKMREEMKPNPWISADSEIKPNEDALVVGHSPNGRVDVLRYHGDVFVDELNQEHCIDMWMPIPPFTQPLL